MAKGATKCSYCNQLIKYIIRKDKKPIPVQASSEYYIPQSGGPATYVTPKGEIQSGRPATDGRKGNRLHSCERG